MREDSPFIRNNVKGFNDDSFEFVKFGENNKQANICNKDDVFIGGGKSSVNRNQGENSNNSKPYAGDFFLDNKNDCDFGFGGGNSGNKDAQMDDDRMRTEDDNNMPSFGGGAFGGGMREQSFANEDGQNEFTGGFGNVDDDFGFDNNNNNNEMTNDFGFGVNNNNQDPFDDMGLCFNNNNNNSNSQSGRIDFGNEANFGTNNNVNSSFGDQQVGFGNEANFGQSSNQNIEIEPAYNIFGSNQKPKLQT